MTDHPHRADPTAECFRCVVVVGTGLCEWPAATMTDLFIHHEQEHPGPPIPPLPSPTKKL